MSTAEKYVTAVYLVFLAALILYVVIIALKLGRLQQELAALATAAKEKRGD